jgi:hypothetical protein
VTYKTCFSDEEVKSSLTELCDASMLKGLQWISDGETWTKTHGHTTGSKQLYKCPYYDHSKCPFRVRVVQTPQNSAVACTTASCQFDVQYTSKTPHTPHVQQETGNCSPINVDALSCDIVGRRSLTQPYLWALGRGVPLSIKAAFAQNPAFKDSKIGQVMRSLRADGLDANAEHPRAFKSRVQNYKYRERETASRLAATVEEGVCSRSWGGVMQLCQRWSKDAVSKNMEEHGRRCVCMSSNAWFLCIFVCDTCHALLKWCSYSTGSPATPAMCCQDSAWTRQTQMT